MFEVIEKFLAVPFGWVLSALYNLTGSYILAIAILTLAVRLLILPASISQQKNSAKQVRLNTKVNKIKTKYAGNQQKIQEETQALYQREGFGASNMGCSSLLISMFVMLGLYGVIRTPISSVLNFSNELIEKIRVALGIVIETGKKGNNTRTFQLEILNKFSENKEALTDVLSAEQFSALETLREKFTIFGIDLTLTPDSKDPSILWLIPILAGLTALASSVFMYIRQRKQNPEMAKNPTMGCMTFMSPAMSLWFTFMFPAGVGVYWIISNIISFVQQVVLTNIYSPKKVIAQQMVDETVKRRSRENNVKRRVENENK
ncbi:MAG: YidC/Oxa1 family membrane protein insertase [Clostridia bacterium]|nr:YidC/Oxa1 family membrane protein insertase [Clostridia bacterium]